MVSWRGQTSKPRRWVVALACASLLLVMPGAVGTGLTMAAAAPTDLWVDAAQGNDAGDGMTPSRALRTIQKAADRATAGATIHILPGIYRESIRPASSGAEGAPITYTAENGLGTVKIRGSIASSSFAWTQLDANTLGLPASVDPRKIYYADLSNLALTQAPRYLVALDGAGEVETRLAMAREPDWEVKTEWKNHEFWWSADGGSTPAGCYPPTDPNPTDCDLASRSTTQLLDRTDDTAPVGIEPGNLTTLGDLTGASLVAVDTRQGHYTYTRTITAHDVASGRITVDRVCEHDWGSGLAGLGWGTKYYVQGKPVLLDQPGEWWYDATLKRLYLWPPDSGSPAVQPLEISYRSKAFDLKDRSYIVLQGLQIELYDGNAYSIHDWYDHGSQGNVIRNTVLRYAKRGILLSQGVGRSYAVENIIDGFLLEQSEVGFMDGPAIETLFSWEGDTADAFLRSGIRNITIRGNELHHLGFFDESSDSGVGNRFYFPDHFRFEDNHVHHTAHIGVHFAKSVIQSSKSFGFDPSEIKTGDILVRGNLFEQACLQAADCGALKFWGKTPDYHVFRDVLVTENILRDTHGWTSISEQRGRWAGGSVRGMGGFGFYADFASGLHLFRNIVYNTAYSGVHLYGTWRDGEMVLTNNLFANSLVGIRLSAAEYDTHGNVNTQVVDNIFVNNEARALTVSDADGQLEDLHIDHNLYSANGWGQGITKPGVMSVSRTSMPTLYLQTVEEVRASTPWEDAGRSGDPAFVAFDPADHNRTDGSWPDFRLTQASVEAIDRGVSELPSSLSQLLSHFGIDGGLKGSAYDIGRFEYERLASFADVPFDHPYWREIEALWTSGYTAGCATNPLRYCPEQTINRAGSAVFVERGIHGATYDPPAPTTQVFADLALDSWAAKWVNGLWQDQYTAGCGTNPLVYCPWQGHTRAEGCVFYLRMLKGATFEPEQPTQQTFTDVPLDAWYAKWVQSAYDTGLLEACQTSPDLRFCPNDPLTRAVAAHMMVRAKGLTLP